MTAVEAQMVETLIHAQVLINKDMHKNKWVNIENIPVNIKL